MRRSSSIVIKIFSLPGSSEWELGHKKKKKIAVDLFSVRRTDNVERWQFFAKFGFSVGITIIVETNKKVELSP